MVWEVSFAGLRAWHATRDISIAVKLLPILTRTAVSKVLPLILIEGGKELTLEAFRKLLTPLRCSPAELNTPWDSRPEKYYPWGGQDLLGTLFDYGQMAGSSTQKVANSADVSESNQRVIPQVELKRVIEGLDCCFEMATGDAPLIPLSAFANFINKVVENCVSSAATTSGPNASRPPSTLPRLFGRLLLLVVIQLPSLSEFLATSVFPRLFRHSAALETAKPADLTQPSPIWADAVTWRGIVAAFVKAWAQCRTHLAPLLWEVPGREFETLVQELQRLHPTARVDLCQLVRATSQGGRVRVPPHVAEVLGLVL